MAIVRFDPFGALRELERAFATPLSSVRTEGTWAPRVDVYNHDGSLVVRAEVPGVNPEDIDVTVEGDSLTISGSRRFETETEKDGFHRKEIFQGSFSRSVALPEGTDADAVSATSKDGILEVTVPMPAEVMPRKIEVAVQS